MAFSFGNAGSASGFGAGAQNQNAQLGPELPEIQTQEVGFLSIAGDSKIRLFPTPWPNDALPPPTASLLSVASTKGLLAAAGPEGLIIASTDVVRKAYTAEPSGNSAIKPFQPQAQIPLPQKASHVAFSSDDGVLVVAAADGSGLIAYDVSGLLQGAIQPALTLSMNGASLRALAPNPTTAELFAAVTVKGELLMANLKTSELLSGPNGPVLKTGVSCVSWSNKGKQLVAGLADGTAVQMTPDGTVKAELPRPPDAEANMHVSSISWLENNSFFMVYTPSQSAPDDRPSSSYYILTRQPPATYGFQKLPEVCPPFGMERNPAYQFLGRLRDFEPDLKDVLIVSSTSSTDIGLFTHSSKSLCEDSRMTGVTGVFTATSMSEDSRRADLPMTEDMADTSPIGLAIDLSSKDIVTAPIPGEEIEDSANPLPQVMVLNNEGVLASWWFVYSESIRQKKPYRGLVGAKEPQQSQPQAVSMTPPTPKPGLGRPAFGQSTFGQPSFGQPAAASFGTPSALGSNRQPAFGTPSALGASSFAKTGFGAQTTDQQPSSMTSGPTFGSSTPMGAKPAAPAFGSPSALGQRAPAFGQSTPMGKPNAGPTFGQSSTPGGFGAFSAEASKTPSGFPSAFGGGGEGGFSSFASGGGFGSVAPQPSGASPFAKAGGDSPFAKAGQPMFGSSGEAPSAGGSFGLGSSGFNLGTGFKKDENASMDEDKLEENNKSTLSMGPSFGNILNPNGGGEPNALETKPTPQSPFAAPSAPEPKSIFGNFQKPSTPSAPPTSLFGPPLQPPKPVSPKVEEPAPLPPSPPAPKDVTAEAPPSIPTESSISDSTIKVEPPSDTESTPIPKLSEPPLPPEPPFPPEPTSKTSYAPGDTSASSSSISKGSYEEAPLPPDFIAPKKRETPAEVPAALPEESEGEAADFEDSGEDVTNDVSPVEETGERVTSLKTSPESSFENASDRTINGDPFTKVSAPMQQQKGPKQLFGEISQPMFPPPRLQSDRPTLSPRSPSPVRRQLGGLRNEAMRSTSAPSAPGRALANRRVTLEKSMLMNQVKPPSDDVSEEEQPERKETEDQRRAQEAQQLDEDDEDEQLRADLARPLSPAPTLDPFLPHQDYTGETLKPGIPGQIERLYRDINSMIDTLGMNSRSLSSFLLYQETSKDKNYDAWMSILQGDQPRDILEEKLSLSEVGKLKESLNVLEQDLRRGTVDNVHEKLAECEKLFATDLVKLRGQCASIRRSIDNHTDSIAIASAPLSAEQATLQQDLRKASTTVQSKIADLEREISILRAGIADSSRSDGDKYDTSRRGRKSMARPTVEAVTSTIATMTKMAEKKSGDIDVLEAQMRKLGIDVSGSVTSRSREGSPFHTPPPKRRSRLPATPGSHGSADGTFRSSYHTPDSSSRTRFRSSILGSASKDAGVNGAVVPADLVLPEDSERWKAKDVRRKEIMGHLRGALGERKAKVRSMDEI